METKEKILIVDDEKDIALLLKRYLSPRLPVPFDLITAFSYSEALDLLNNNEFRLCIFDYNLGDGSGKNLLQKAVSEYRTTTAIMMSAYATKKEVKEFYDLGALGFLQKPLSLDHLEQILGNFTP